MAAYFSLSVCFLSLVSILFLFLIDLVYIFKKLEANVNILGGKEWTFVSICVWFDVQHVLESSWLWWERNAVGILVLRILELGNYVKSRAKQWNGSKGLKNGSWACFYVLTVWPHVAGWACGLLQLSYWWDCSCPQIMQVWQPASSWVRVTLEHERHGVVCCLVFCFSSAQVFFPLPYVISYDRLRATKGSLSNSSWGRPQWSSGAGWSTMPGSAVLKTLLEYVFHSPTE